MIGINMQYPSFVASYRITYGVIGHNMKRKRETHHGFGVKTWRTRTYGIPALRYINYIISYYP